jgi:hypothetical protein
MAGYLETQKFRIDDLDHLSETVTSPGPDSNAVCGAVSAVGSR